MTGKITWEAIYKDFRSNYPNLRKNITDWQPHGYLTILIFFDDGRKMVYDYLRRHCAFVDA